MLFDGPRPPQSTDIIDDDQRIKLLFFATCVLILPEVATVTSITALIIVISYLNDLQVNRLGSLACNFMHPEYNTTNCSQ